MACWPRKYSNVQLQYQIYPLPTVPGTPYLLLDRLSSGFLGA